MTMDFAVDRSAQGVLQALQQDGVTVVGRDLGGPTYRRVAWTVGAAAPEVTALPIELT